MNEPMERFYAVYNLFLNFINFFSPSQLLIYFAFLKSLIDQVETRGT